MDVRREQIPLLWSTVGDTALPLAKGFVFLGVGYEVFECVCRRTKGCACRFLQLLPGSVYSEDLALFRVNVYVPSALPLHAERICILRGLGTFQGECLCSICPPMQRACQGHCSIHIVSLVLLCADRVLTDGAVG